VRSASGGGPGDLVKVNPRGGREDLVISGPPDDREPTWYMAGSRSSAARQRDVALQRGQELGGVCCDRAVATGADARRLRSGQVWSFQLSLRAVRSGLTCRYSTAGSARSRSATGDGWDPTDKTVTLNNVDSDTVNVHVVGGEDDDCLIPVWFNSDGLGAGDEVSEATTSVEAPRPSTPSTGRTGWRTRSCTRTAAATWPTSPCTTRSRSPAANSRNADVGGLWPPRQPVRLPRPPRT
jgi:hypothetical protein